MVGIKGGSVGIHEPDAISDGPRVSDVDSMNSGMLVATMEF